MSTWRILAAGDRAWLVELAVLEEALALFRLIEADRLAGVLEVVPAARTVLIQFDPARLPALRLRGWLARQLQVLAARGAGAGGGADGAAATRLVEIPVQYAGDDLAEVGEALGLTRTELIARHVGCDYQCAFAGFSPGFVYLSGGDPCFHVITRRAVPRARVPAGSVAVAAGFCAVYPSDSPGGWRLLGRTPLRMWDLQRADPALLQPGLRVRFRDLDAPDVHYSLPAAGAREAASLPPPIGAQAAAPDWLEVLDPGLLTLFQDDGRRGMSHLGIARSGALDRAALRAANRLVGNAEDAPALENALGGLRLRCHGQAVVAVTGARVTVSLTTTSGMRLPAATDSPLDLADGQILRLGRPRAGMRSYVAVAGGWVVEPVLGSCSTDVLARIGPPALARGDALPLAGRAAGAARPSARSANAPACPGEALPRVGDVLTVRVLPGPRADWFGASALQDLAGCEWRVMPQSNRVGLRLSGPRPLLPVRTGELASEGMVAGAIEIPHGGQPIVFLADHPLTGGYPVIAVVVGDDLDSLGQLPPGARLRFALE